jgi:TIR domain
VGGVFICYRRDDNRHAAGRLYDGLRQKFPSDQIFFDVDNIEPGLSFVEVIKERVAASDAIVVVIGPGWVNSRDRDGRRRLHDPADFVRIEIQAGLDRNIRVIPVLIDGAAMPRMADLPDELNSLHSRQAITLHHNSFQRDLEHLNSVLGKIVQFHRPSASKNDNAIPINDTRTGLDTYKNASRDWKAELIGRRWNHFLIQVHQLSECHQVECTLNWWRIFDYVNVDGVPVFYWAITGPKTTEFRLGSHPVSFRLKFRSTSLYRLKEIELWADNYRLLFSE